MNCQLIPAPGRGAGFYVCKNCGINSRGMVNRLCTQVRGNVVIKNPTQAPQLVKVVPNTTGKLRVGIVTPAILLGGAELWILSLVKHLDSRIKVMGVSITDRKPPIDPILGPEIQKFTTLNYNVAEMSANCDVLVVWGVYGLSQYIPSNFPGPIVFVSHGGGQWTDLIVKSNLSIITHCVAVSEKAKSPFPKDRDVTVIYNGIEEDRCTPLTSKTTMRQRWGIQDGEKAIGYFGRFSFEKNVKGVVEAVNTMGPGYRCVLTGDGWKKKEILLSLEGLDFIYTGRCDQPGDVLNALDCFMLVSPSEGFSLALIEAWYCGCPTVTTPVGSYEETLSRHGKLLTMVPITASAKEMGDAALSAMGDKQTILHAKNVAHQYYTASIMGKNWSDYLMRIH